MSGRSHALSSRRADHIPVLVAEDGSFYRGTREIFAHLDERHRSRFAAVHRRRFADHQDDRVSVTGHLIEHFGETDELGTTGHAN